MHESSYLVCDVTGVEVQKNVRHEENINQQVCGECPVYLQPIAEHMCFSGYVVTAVHEADNCITVVLHLLHRDTDELKVCLLRCNSDA